MTRNMLAGVAASLIATIILSLLMLIKGAMGFMTQLDVAAMISSMMGRPEMPAIGWAVHFMIGTLAYGLALAFIDLKLDQSRLSLALGLSIAGWLMMMMVLMPMAGAGLFALNMGPMAMIATLMLHLIFGLALGLTFQRFAPARRNA